ncbi:hypothetical protein RUE5091_02198 [Ruegeria denitrificans]|uniref:Uncharacterized protein n=1 Tax=Ruegeria denitrificans TaxID=1715692 RepID=A0A0P1IA83_9RHOB|nr:hypothetical protein [Ruegeria denitrificans]CUK00989.1 hypothetical protein RUE5091_02198 [Ruegeria denitrificans]
MQDQNSKTNAAEALELLEQAWAYYTPEPAPLADAHEPELFEYASAA